MGFSVTPPFKSAKPQKITIACTIIGVPRNISIYAANIQSPIFLNTLKAVSWGIGMVRYIPISMPIIRPIIVLISETSRV